MDNDGFKMQDAMTTSLFPTTNYGRHTTIGTIEHLKSPSMYAIKQYYAKYYVPNNMAIVMSGDFNSDSIIGKIDAAFSYMQYKPVDLYNPAPETPMTSTITKDIFGPSPESVRICYRNPAANTHDAMVLDLISNILSNGTAGLLDLNLNQQQKVQQAQAGIEQFKDCGVFIFEGKPKQDQSLDSVKDLLFSQIAILKSGGFDDSLIKAITANKQADTFTII